MNSKEWIKLGKQGIPVILILWYFLFPQTVRAYSDSYLGKFFFLLIICFYAFYDTAIGILVCLLVILFYHIQIRNAYEPFLSKSTEDYMKHIPKPFRKILSGEIKYHLAKDYTCIEEAYPTKLAPIKKVGEALFRKEKCHQYKVQYKNQTMKDNMVTHVYPELQFREEICNPCDQICHFTIEKKQSIEKELAPKNTHTSVVEDIQELLGKTKNDPVVVHENFVVSTFS